jgi:hypothetical protein
MPRAKQVGAAQLGVEYVVLAARLLHQIDLLLDVRPDTYCSPHHRMPGFNAQNEGSQCNAFVDGREISARPGPTFVSLSSERRYNTSEVPPVFSMWK